MQVNKASWEKVVFKWGIHSFSALGSFTKAKAILPPNSISIYFPPHNDKINFLRVLWMLSGRMDRVERLTLNLKVVGGDPEQ